MGSGRQFLCAILCAITLLCARAMAIDAIADDPRNVRWHASEKTSRATFLAGDRAESAILILKKSAVLGQTFTVQSDGKYIVLQSGESPHVLFQTPGKPEGTSSKIALKGGDQPGVSLDDREQVQQLGKWIQVLSASDPTIRLEIGNATFAEVLFEKPVVAATQPVVVAEAPTQKPRTGPAANELLHNVTANQLASITNAFDQGVAKKCTSCQGTGKVTVKVQTGTQQQGMFSVPVYSTELQQCTRCHGSGIDRSKDEALVRLSGALVKAMASLNPDDPRGQETLTRTYKEITEKMIGDRPTWTLLTADGRSILAQSAPKLGSTVVSLVEVKRSDDRGEGHRRFLVRVLGTDKEVFVDDPVLADEVRNGKALMGGIVAAPNTDKGSRVTTLHGGFLIAPPITRDWYWWYKDQ